ncbi:MAG: serine--tRNA ligase, partial [Bacillota bacterium]|nr:serine--tRNA ligase [Bacillota bacterium]
MLELNRIRENPEKVKELLARKGWEADFTELNIDFTRRSELLVQIETVKAEQNRLSASVPAVKKQNGDIQAIFAKVRELTAKNAAAEAELKDLQAKIDQYVAALPNTPDEDLLSGGKENNQPIRTNLTKPVFAFPVKNHVELCEAIGLIDYARAAKIS